MDFKAKSDNAIRNLQFYWIVAYNSTKTLKSCIKPTILDASYMNEHVSQNTFLKFPNFLYKNPKYFGKI